MTTAVATPTSPLDGIRLRFSGLLRSEWIKLRSLRSTLWCYLLIILATAGFAALMALSSNVGGDVLPQATQNAMTVQYLTVGGNFTSLIAAVLGVLVISGEYTTGMIRTTYTAAPGRLSAYAAKAVVLTVVTFIVGLASIAAALAVSLPLFAANGVSPDLGDPAVALPLVGAAGFLALIALLSFSLGAILRNSAGGIAAAVGLLFVAPIGISLVGGFTGAAWAQNIGTILPGNVGAALYAYTGEGSGPAPEPGVVDGVLVLDQTWSLVVFAAWIVVGLVLGAILTKRRDV
ncbi:ABC-2 type transport system permease protein [Paramicrobacterium humi]|uniref:ABC-2 type transport system permease protein n=1 Tax=Paramicrobacterium humi TaxID=640635 RepID=A0A1H4MZ42_9MICO|nr:ABC transporter permease subunit [Microbacterium humi]SEB87632.1 ABC-2 type transport system permease protein [Microbacterium humi]